MNPGVLAGKNGKVRLVEWTHTGGKPMHIILLKFKYILEKIHLYKGNHLAPFILKVVEQLLYALFTMLWCPT